MGPGLLHFAIFFVKFAKTNTAKTVECPQPDSYVLRFFLGNLEKLTTLQRENFSDCYGFLKCVT